MTRLRMLAVAAAVGLAACPAPDEAHEAITDRPGATPGAPTITPTPAAASFELEPVAATGARGQATVREATARTSLQLTLREAPPAATLSVAVHRGGCDEPGPQVHPLEPVITDAEGRGTSVTWIELPFESLADGRHVVLAAEAADPAHRLACGQIPRAG